MVDFTTDKLAQRLLDLGLLELRQVNAAWSEIGSHNVSVDDFRSYLLRKELLTNFQLERVLKGERAGYFYGPYKVLYIIGTGTFARVYRAVHRETQRVMAVKVLRKRFREEAPQVEQFMREARFGMKLRHPNIVTIYDVSGDVQAPYMVMEFVEGQNLREMIRIRKSIDPLTALKLLADIASALVYAGEQGISHRDMKMSNVLVTSTGRAKLVDFGLAAVANRDNEDALADCPNARAIDYATLERGTGVRKDDARSDLFFAGCILYNMVSGNWPLLETRDRLQRLNVSRFQNIVPLGKACPELPASVLMICHKAMEMDPSRRHQTPSELLNDAQSVIRAMESGESVSQVSNREDADRAQAVTDAAAAAGDVGTSNEGESRTVMLVESKTEMQDLLRDALKRRGYRVLILSDPNRALARFEMEPDAADCVVFSAPELGGEALDAFNQFGSSTATREIPAILLVDQKQQNIIRRAQVANHRVLLTMPLKVRELRQALLKLMEPAGLTGGGGAANPATRANP